MSWASDNPEAWGDMEERAVARWLDETFAKLYDRQPMTGAFMAYALRVACSEDWFRIVDAMNAATDHNLMRDEEREWFAGLADDARTAAKYGKEGA